MQAELDTVSTALPIRIRGVNAAGQESGNAANCAGRTIPWLQDTGAMNAWNRWRVTWRDVLVLDGENRLLLVYNLTDHDLANSAHYAALRNALLTAAADSAGP